MMNIFKSKLFQFGAAMAVVATLVVMTPKAAHGLAAALVQVTNTSASPAITQGVDKQAAQLVESNCFGAPSFVTNCPAFVGPNLTPITATQTWVITSVDFTPETSSSTACGSSASVEPATITANNGAVVFGSWYVSGPATTHYTFPSGFPVTAGGGGQLAVGPSSSCYISASMRGYVTPN